MAIKLIIASLLGFSGYAVSNPIFNSSQPAHVLLDESLAALGGAEAIDQVKGITYQAPNIFRSWSLMQSYELRRADTAVATSGSQNVSYSYASDELIQRIDRRFTASDYWTWGKPNLEPFDFSLVVRGGDDGFACYVRGNNQIWLPSGLHSGYTDSALADYLVTHGEMLSPKLLTKMKSNNNTSSSRLEINGVQMSSVYDPDLDLTVIFHPKSSLPYIIRSSEDHPIYGSSTNDLYLTNYTVVDGIMFPHTIQTIYNSSSQHLNAPIENFHIEHVKINPEFLSDFFEGISEDESFSPKAAPRRVEGYSYGRITEFSSNMLWSGLADSTAEKLRAEQPVPGLPELHWVILNDETLGVKQMVIEFENEVIVCDAAPQWSHSLIQWVADNIKKPITHVWPTHHHRDHSGGVGDFIAQGAKLIVPEMAVDYWSSVPNATLVTFNDTHPYVHSDDNIQAWFMWQPHALHSSDWSYSFITTKCPSADSPAAVFQADAWQAGLPLEQSDQTLMRAWMDQVLVDGVTENAMVVPAHGQVRPLSELIELTGFPYPQLSTTNWRGGAALG